MPTSSNLQDYLPPEKSLAWQRPSRGSSKAGYRQTFRLALSFGLWLKRQPWAPFDVTNYSANLHSASSDDAV